MGESSGDERPSPREFIEDALIEAHHLANLTGLDEAELARRRLVNAQSATRRAKTRDLLADACEYLELARLERADAAAGFAKARRYARNAQLTLRPEISPLVDGSVAELLAADFPSETSTLEDLRQDAAVSSYDGLKRDTALELAFAEIRSQASDGVIEHPNAVEETSTGERSEPATNGVDADPVTNGERTGSVGDGSDAHLDAEDAIRMASLEVEIRRALQRTRAAHRESEFQFLTSEQIVAEETSETS